MMERPIEEWNLPNRHLGRRTLIFPSVGSTNTFALSLANDPANHGLAVLAREQTAGRGQHGRKWQAPPGSSVLLSILLFPPPCLRRPSLLTAWAAVSVCETILHICNLQAKIKWPNDVLIHGKKVCGILIEQRPSGLPESPLATVVGIGLNVAQPDQFFIDAGLPEGASLSSISGLALEIEPTAKRLLQELDDEYDRLIQGDAATLEAMWKWRLGLLGKQVGASTAHETHRGRLIDVTLNAVTLLTANGKVEKVAPEKVQHLESLSEPRP
ncbi:MAG: biotin--[acetyl-CoA-carboxylase] ligase [Planctomycetes bacterium]|nr:biotin--[acetyl-CoA-carboxylase] ligase [Planctomycetota bacterium]